MDVKIREFFDSVGSFFTGGDNFPWCDRNIVAIAPDWRQAQTRQKVEEDRTAKGTLFASHGVIGIVIAATVVGLLVGGIAAVVARKK